MAWFPPEQRRRSLAAFGHMHLLGRSIKVELDPGTTQAKTLIDVPAFDFDGQRLQVLTATIND